MAIREQLTSKTLLTLGRASRAIPHFRGKSRALRLLDRTLRRVGELDGPVRCDLNGLRMDLDPTEGIQFSLLYTGSYGANVRFFLDAAIRQHPDAQGPPILWDIGANIGAISLTLANGLPQLAVHSFEPSPSVHATLAHNLGLNPHLTSRVTLHELALSNEAGEATFYPSDQDGNQGVGSLQDTSYGTAKAITVRRAVPDTLIADGLAPPPTHIKIDVEGFEMEVLLGLEAMLAGPSPPTVVVEHAIERLDSRGMPRDAVTHWLVERGFHLHFIHPDGTTHPQTYADRDRHHDYAAIPTGQG
ncbi:MAG: FkbM family methyltransferase [Myxococcota bacterium]|jgi:FkbM family methyltransferase